MPLESSGATGAGEEKGGEPSDGWWCGLRRSPAQRPRSADPLRCPREVPGDKGAILGRGAVATRAPERPAPPTRSEGGAPAPPARSDGGAPAPAPSGPADGPRPAPAAPPRAVDGDADRSAARAWRAFSCASGVYGVRHAGPAHGPRGEGRDGKKKKKKVKAGAGADLDANAIGALLAAIDGCRERRASQRTPTRRSRRTRRKERAAAPRRAPSLPAAGALSREPARPPPSQPLAPFREPVRPPPSRSSAPFREPVRLPPSLLPSAPAPPPLLDRVAHWFVNSC